jgi:hypothetical protein
MEGSGAGSVLVTEADPEGPKKYGSGSTTLFKLLDLVKNLTFFVEICWDDDPAGLLPDLVGDLFQILGLIRVVVLLFIHDLMPAQLKKWKRVKLEAVLRIRYFLVRIRIRTSDYRVRLRILLFSSVIFKMATHFFCWLLLEFTFTLFF